MDWSLRSISAVPLLYCVYGQSHVSLSSLFRDGVLKQLCLRRGKWPVFAVPQFTRLLFSSTHIYHRKVQGCNGWAHLGGLACCSLIHGHHGPLPLWCNIACTKQMTPPGQWMGPFLYIFLVPFSNEKKEILLFFEQHSNVDWKCASSGVNCCVWSRALVFCIWRAHGLDSDGGIWTWTARSDLSLGPEWIC